MNVHDGCNALNALTTVFSSSQRNVATGEKQKRQISFHFGEVLVLERSFQKSE